MFEKDNFKCSYAQLCLDEKRKRNFRFCIQTCVLFGCDVCVNQKIENKCLNCIRREKK